MNEAIELLENYDDIELRNAPHFVYANMHGNLKLKMTSAVNERLFFNFTTSIIELSNLIEKNQNNINTERDDEGEVQGDNLFNTSMPLYS